MEPLSTILSFLVNDPLPNYPNFYRNRLLGLGTRYGEKIRFIMKLRTLYLHVGYIGTSKYDISLFGVRPLT